MKWFIGVAVILLVALILESGLLAYSMYVLFGLLVTSRYLARQWVESLSASRTCAQSTAEIGESVTVSITIRNSGWLPIPWVLLEDLLPAEATGVVEPRLRIKGDRLQVRMIRSRGQVVMKYRLKPQLRGYYQIGPLVSESGDLFGLHRRNRVLTRPDFLLVYPKIVPLEGYDLASRRPIGEVRLSHRLYEDPTRVNGVREYQAGDPMNRVHWGATARRGQLHCKVYEPSTLSGSTILLDFHQSGYPTRGEPVRSELAVTAAVALAHAVAQMGQQVGLMTNGHDAVDRIRLEQTLSEYRTREAARSNVAMRERSDRLRPVLVQTRRDVEQFQRIRETLARVELSDGLAFHEFIGESACRLPRDATVVAIVPSIPTATALALGNLRRAGYAVTVIAILLDDGELHEGIGRLLAEGVQDVRHLKSETELPSLCQQQLTRSLPYQLAFQV